MLRYHVTFLIDSAVRDLLLKLLPWHSVHHSLLAVWASII